ncbi:succinate dehydrogenase [Streptomyces scopuliridis]|uniref:Succinate dehydrogenase n=1 Tax=Streptomyces scopuliridis TaxID=452529 RepID=A0ACD4ZVA7_9ACTN|nr:succinate dehydrogenase [Streptomyces scopuliridis]WSC02185.1 succinate dehydrogenase [Streptomyces scopuliridis]WSC04278.1 succinate dehydrogenase [Streptomyces scopuliridis]
MALATRGTDQRPSMTRTLWGSTIGKKTIMAVSGLIMLGYLVVHMLGNLKIFFGPPEFNGYAHWLRTMGEPFLHYEWALWIVRVVLVVAVVLHAVCAYQLSRRDLAARPSKYVHRRARAGYATRTMRWGGIILALFIVWHVLDLTTGTVHSGGFQAGHPYQNVVDTFSTWYGNVIYLVAMLALGLHVQHGFWSAAQTLGAGNASRERVLKGTANLLALALTAGFIAVPVAVMTGVVS